MFLNQESTYSYGDVVFHETAKAHCLNIPTLHLTTMLGTKESLSNLTKIAKRLCYLLRFHEHLVGIEWIPTGIAFGKAVRNRGPKHSMDLALLPRRAGPNMEEVVSCSNTPSTTPSNESPLSTGSEID